MATGRGIFDSTQKIVTNGLVLHLDAALLRSYARGGATTWYDMAGSNDNFTLYNGPTFLTTYGGEIQFDGVNDYARMRSSVALPQMTSTGTMEIWVRSNTNGNNFGSAAYGRAVEFCDVTNTGSDTGGAQGAGDAAVANYFTLLKNNTADNLSAIFARDINGANTGQGFYVGSNASVVNADGLYRHIVYTWSSSGTSRTLAGYVNNVLRGSNTYTYNLFFPATMSTCTLGMQSLGSNTSPSAVTAITVGAFRLYNRALTATEVAQNWTIQRARFGR